MANYKTQAINLKTYNLGEKDKIVVMYSKDFGIIRCVVKGVKNPNSKFGARMDIFAANNLFIAKGKKLDIVCQAELIDGFKEIRKDITKLTYAFYCIEIINSFGLEDDQNSSKIYDLSFECLKNIDLSSNTDEILWSAIRFKLKLLKQLGYAVELDYCVKCNNIVDDSPSFCSESGGVICKSCRNKIYKVIDLDYNVLKIFKDALKFDFPENDNIHNNNELILSFCFNLLKEYISFRSHKKLKTSELIGTLC